MPHNFSTEFASVKSTMDLAGFDTETEAAALVKGLKKALGPSGFEPSHSESLDKLRTHVGKMGFGQNEGKRTLALAKVASGDKFATDAPARQRVAALKTLRHSYLVTKAGAVSVWIVNTPKAYRDWPGAEIDGAATTERALLEKLNKTSEYFGYFQRRDIFSGSRAALHWVQKTLIVLANYGKDKGESAKLVKRWFETKDTSASDLTDIVAKLTSGFKLIQAALNSNQLIFTDYPPDRGTADERDTEAFVFNGGWKDGLRVVYIEKGFFARGANVLSGRDNWARIIVHELSHSQVGTEDYPADNSYAWQGINPKDAKFVGNGAIRNAENWAYLAADCADAMSKSELARAQKL
jgi:Lysine-specific metallo-endopeptidase